MIDSMKLEFSVSPGPGTTPNQGNGYQAIDDNGDFFLVKLLKSGWATRSFSLSISLGITCAITLVSILVGPGRTGSTRKAIYEVRHLYLLPRPRLA